MDETWTLVLDGNFEKVVLKNVTLDPGGPARHRSNGQDRIIPTVKLEIKGFVETLEIEKSIAGPVFESVSFSGGAIDPCSVGDIFITDSIVDSGFETDAISTTTGTVHLKRSTVFGNVRVNRLYASEALIDGYVNVNDMTNGCFRYSATARKFDLGEVPDTTENEHRVPKAYESHFYSGTLPQGTFISKTFGDAGYAQLSMQAPAAIRRGAENTSELGVFNAEISAIKLSDLRQKIDEFKPVQLVPQFIFET